MKTSTTWKDGTVQENKQYVYDKNGNEIGQTNGTTGEILYRTYDAENRLTEVSVNKDGKNAVVQQNRYNGDGQRIQRVEGDQTTNYYYQDGVVSYTTDGKGEQTSQDLLGTDGNVIGTQRYTGNDTAYYVYNKDVQGSTTNLLKDDGKADVSYRYEDFGETQSIGENTAKNETCYTGGRYDETTGLYYLNARYYNPEDGRFLSEDTYRGETNEPDTQHLYAYCSNNPINYVDPSGHKKKVIDISRRLETLMMANARSLYNRAKNALSGKNKIKKLISLYKYFYKSVKTNGKWDLKRKRSWKLNEKKEVYKYGSRRLTRNDDVGNIHFGFVGSVLFNREFLCLGAGLYQVKSGTSRWKYALSYGDDPHDSNMIRFGNSLFHSTGCASSYKKVTKYLKFAFKLVYVGV